MFTESYGNHAQHTCTHTHTHTHTKLCLKVKFVSDVYDPINVMLIIILESQKPHQPQEHIPDFDISEFDNIAEAFLYLTSNISKQLRSEDFYTVRRACTEQINTPNRVQLPPDMKECVQAANDFNALLDTFNWQTLLIGAGLIYGY